MKDEEEIKKQLLKIEKVNDFRYHVMEKLIKSAYGYIEELQAKVYGTTKPNEDSDKNT